MALHFSADLGYINLRSMLPMEIRASHRIAKVNKNVSQDDMTRTNADETRPSGTWYLKLWHSISGWSDSNKRDTVEFSLVFFFFLILSFVVAWSYHGVPSGLDSREEIDLYPDKRRRRLVIVTSITDGTPTVPDSRLSPPKMFLLRIFTHKTQQHILNSPPKKQQQQQLSHTQQGNQSAHTNLKK